MTIYTYDTRANRYYEFIQVAPEVMESFENDPHRWVITEPEIIEQIEKINGPGLRRFIQIKDGVVSINIELMRQSAIDQFKYHRTEVLQRLDTEFFKLQEKLILSSDDAEKESVKEQIKQVVSDKELWRDIAKHPLIETIVDWDTYVESIRVATQELDPYMKKRNEGHSLVSVQASSDGSGGGAYIE